jgi:hypothetical protein
MYSLMKTIVRILRPKTHMQIVCLPDTLSLKTNRYHSKTAETC